MKKSKKNKGITLIVLVVTIIILLILAGISIAALTSDNGLINMAKQAKQNVTDSQDDENRMTDDYINELHRIQSGTIQQPEEPQTPKDPIVEKQDKILSETENTIIKDKYENQIVVPPGFKITTDASDVTQGIVIEDSSGNQFVWIPVGTIKKADGTTVDILLSRYGTNSGKLVAVNDSPIGYYKESTTPIMGYGNQVAKNIQEFKDNTKTNCGYYIARYEAGKEGDTEVVVSKSGATLYNNVTQYAAGFKSKTMYTSTKFTSDLVNSYAWDTAILFLETFDNRTNSLTKYSNETSSNSKISVVTGTGTSDKICNVYDMASNVKEWSTETYTNGNLNCVIRGGLYNSISDYAFTRTFTYTYSSEKAGFRVILYLNT